MIKIGQQKQEKQNTFNENSKNKASDPEKITDLKWLKYKLRFWRCNKRFIQMVFFSASLALSFDTGLNCNRNYLTLLIFKTNTFFQIWQLRHCLINLKLVWLETSFQRKFSKKIRIGFNVHAPSESFFKVGRLEDKSVPNQREFSSSNWRHILFSYLR